MREKENLFFFFRTDAGISDFCSEKLRNYKEHERNLVSDVSNNSSSSNQGTTLPGGNDSTYDAELSPLFLTRSGDIYNGNANERTTTSQVWSNTAHTFGSTIGVFANLLNINRGGVLPSLKFPRAYAYSLRCLVSTTNS